jgi:CubicO group peptidase (beta-lactamase class C family)
MARRLLPALARLAAGIAFGCSLPPADPIDPGTSVTAQEQTAQAPSSCGQGPITSADLDTSSLDPFLIDHMQASGAPGMAVAVVGGGKIKWTKGYGLANIEENRPATPDTLFMLASVSKTITAVALMSLIEDAKSGILLDSDIDEVLPFPVRNPSFPDVPITYRMLLTHTSSFIDSEAQLDFIVPGDSPIPLLDFEEEFVQHEENWSDAPPGTAFAYSNIGAALVGLLAQRISSRNLQDYAKQAIFDKLGMPETSYFLRDLDPSHIAMPYEDGEPQGLFGYPDFPDGQIRTSVTQLAHFLLMLTGKGECGGQRVVSATTIAKMEAPQIPDIDPGYGLIFFHETVDGIRVIGHNGADHGVSTEMFFDETTGNGYIVLTNGPANMHQDQDQVEAFDAIGDKLMELATTLP